MSKLFLFPLILLGLVGSIAFTRAVASPDDVEWPSAAVLGVGDSLDLPDGSTLEFLALVEDSRCPADAMCIWQGRAVVEFALDGAKFEVTYTGGGESVVVGDVAIEVRDVQPYPLASQPHDPADTEVTVAVKSID